KRVDLTGAAEMALPSTPKDRHDQTQHDADNDAGDDREIERRVTTLDSNVARQSTYPFRRESGPKDYPNKCNHGADHDQNFAELSHTERRLRSLPRSTRL